MGCGGVCVTGVWVQVLLVLTHTTPTLASMLLTYHTDTSRREKLNNILLDTTHNICGYINPLTQSHVFSQGITPHAAVQQPVYKNS